MNFRKTLRKLCFGAAIAVFSLGAATTAEAGFGHATYRHETYMTYSYRVKHVVKYTTKCVAYRQRVRAYRPCGTPYYTWKVAYKWVRVPLYSY